MRTRLRLRKERPLSTAPVEVAFLNWLNRVLRDPRWRALIRERLRQTELAEIRF